MTGSAPGKLRMKGPGHEQGLLRCSAWATAVPGAAQGVVRMMQAAQPQNAPLECAWLAHLSRMSAMMHEYMSSPSGNWMATFLALTCLMRQTVLWICGHCLMSQLDAAAHIRTRHRELQSKVKYLA